MSDELQAIVSMLCKDQVKLATELTKRIQRSDLEKQALQEKARMTTMLSAKQINMLKTIKRHGGTRVMTAVDTRVSKALMSKGLLFALDGFFHLTESAEALLAQPAI